jgi:hypothetical protein
MEILSSCQANYDATGAAITSTAFLTIFVILLLGDGFLTALALKSAISRATPTAPEEKRVSL